MLPTVLKITMFILKFSSQGNCNIESKPKQDHSRPCSLWCH